MRTKETKKTLCSRLIVLPVFPAPPACGGRSGGWNTQAQEVDFAIRDREIEQMKEKMDRELQKNDKTLSDAALGVRSRDRTIITLKGQVRFRRTKEHVRYHDFHRPASLRGAIPYQDAETLQHSSPLRCTDAATRQSHSRRSSACLLDSVGGDTSVLYAECSNPRM